MNGELWLFAWRRTNAFFHCLLPPPTCETTLCDYLSLPSSPLRSILRARTEKCSRRYNYASVCKKKRGARNKRLSSF